VATVILFAVIIGTADYVLSLGVKQLYTSSGSTTTTTANNNLPRPSAIPTSAPAVKPPTHNSQQATPVP
jgi:hypothetical protein